MQVSRRTFLKVCAAGVGTSSLTLLGFAPGTALAEVRTFKLARATETRNTCPYCSVGCGILMYSLGDKAKNVHGRIFHIEGDPDHPVNRGTLCPKGAGLLDFVHSDSRLTHPEYRAPGSQGVAADLLGRCLHPHRQADEGGPRRQLRGQEQGRRAPSTAGTAPASWPPPPPAMKPAT